MTAICLSFLFIASAEKTETEKDKSKALLNDYKSGIVLIRGKAGSGSGFIIELKGHKYLVSNAHVLAGIRAPTFTLLDRSPIKLRSASVAMGHDVLIFEVVEGGKALPTVVSVDSEANVNDGVIVLGNPGSGEVVTSLSGKLVGIGPTRVEIDALIEHGNSGSPIILEGTGKVIGIASDARIDELLSGEKKTRRFGYRLDSIQQWQVVNWVQFYKEADAFDKIEQTTTELAQALKDLANEGSRGKSAQRKYAYDSAPIRTALDSFYAKLRSAETDADVQRASDNLLASLRTAVQGTNPALKPNFTYDYFRRRYAQDEATRTEIMSTFAKALQK